MIIHLKLNFFKQLSYFLDFLLATIVIVHFELTFLLF